MKYNSNTRVLLIYMFLLNDIPFNKKKLRGLIPYQFSHYR